MSAVVEAVGLEKSYGEMRAVRGVDFSVKRGECFGFLGPNGAGKTTTMRMVQAVAAPTAGRLSVLGMDPVSDGKRVRAAIGVCPQTDNLDPDLTVIENLHVYGRYFPQPKTTTQARSEELLTFVALSEKRDRRIAELSGGMKRRLAIARALINEPELLILDEPTTGLDPQARHLVWQKLRELSDRGVTMLLTTHYMDEAERLCDRLVVMDEGRILDEGAPRALVSRLPIRAVPWATRCSSSAFPWSGNARCSAIWRWTTRRASARGTSVCCSSSEPAPSRSRSWRGLARAMCPT